MMIITQPFSLLSTCQT